MHRQSAMIIGVGAYVPPTVIRNEDLEANLNTSDEWIKQRTGIQERHIAEPSSMSTSRMAANAAREALRHANIKPKEIDFIIVSTTTPEFAFPSTAATVGQILGCNAPGFDLSAACTGFVYALSIGQNLIRRGTYDTVLIIASETFSRLVDWRDRNTAVLFGDGAGAVILKANDNSALEYSYFGSDPSGLELLKSPVIGPISMNGREVFKFGSRTVESLIRKALLDTGLTLEDISLIIPHQANERMLSQ
ncbi:beta-ketoacyl-ACP synthase 3, partial [Alicyclobacillus shizuokensis]|uniref:beta-ketoacyl-ACP synthase 3 n=1 Tax=Alicyclobacillus shizuokensis TaxID=392014 RepID=UPI000A658AE7